MLRRQNPELKEIRGSLLSIHCAIKKCAWLAEEARSHLRGRGGADHRFWSCISASKAGSLSSFSGKASSTILAFLAPFTICLERARLQVRKRWAFAFLFSSTGLRATTNFKNYLADTQAVARSASHRHPVEW